MHRNIFGFIYRIVFWGVLSSSFISLYSQSPSFAWTDDPLTTEFTTRKDHFLELRKSVDNLRTLCGLTGYEWTNPSLIEGTTPIRKVHLDELRTAITDVYTNTSVPREEPTFSDAEIQIGKTPVKIIHVSELRNAVDNATCCGDGICQDTYENLVNCPVDCVCLYSDWSNVGCGQGGCFPDQMHQTKTSADPSCAPLFQCVTNDPICCEYNWTDLGCGNDGGGNCKDEEMFRTGTSDLGCPNTSVCMLEAACGAACNYTPWLNGGCGGGSCAADQMLQSATSPTGCSDISQCVLDSACGEAACNYTGWIYGACGENGCPLSNKYRKRTSSKGCPQDDDCINVESCCMYTPWVQGACGGGPCGIDEVYSTRSSTVAGCNNDEGCQWVDSCCQYTKTYSTCGATPCAMNEVLVKLKSAKAVCPPEQWCEYALDCDVNPTPTPTKIPVITPTPSVCTLGTSRDCITVHNCPGRQTCFNDQWEKCVPTNPICTPGANIVCNLSGFPGVQTCNSCGSGYDSCSCQVGFSIPCVKATGTAGQRNCTKKGAWGPCI